MLQERGFSFEDESHENSVLLKMNTIRKEGLFCDAILNIQSHSIPVHKVVLASSSVFFFKLFSSGSLDLQTQYNLDDPHIDTPSLYLIINYFYTSKLECGYDSVRALYKTAHYLKLTNLACKLFEYMVRCLTTHNCLGIYTVMSDIEAKERLEVVKSFIQCNMNSVIECSLEFSQLSTIFVEVFGTCSLDFNLSEQPLCKLIVQWLHSKSLESTEDALIDKKFLLLLTHENKLVDYLNAEAEFSEDPKLLNAKRQPFLEKEQKDKSHSSIKHNDSKSTFLIDDKSFKTPFDPSSCLIASAVVSENTFMSIMHLTKSLVSVSIKFKPDHTLSRRISSSSNVSVTSSYNGSCAKTQSESGLSEDFGTEMRRSQCLMSELATMSMARCGFGVGVIGDYIYVTGGYNRTECLNGVERYNIHKNAWSQCKSMHTVRGRISAGVLDDKLIVCGGSDGANELISVESFDPKENKWTQLPDMLCARSNAGVAVCDGKLYVIGGLSGSKTISKCEVYDSETNKWSPIAELRTGRSQSAVCVYTDYVTSKKCIAVLGGSNSWNCMNLCDSYDPFTDTWHALPHLSVARRGAGAAFFKGMLYVVGGSDGQITLNSVEIFDFTTGHWTFASNLVVPRANMGALVVDKTFYLIGGFSGKSFLRSQEYLDVYCEEWSSFLQADVNVDTILENVKQPSPPILC